MTEQTTQHYEVQRKRKTDSFWLNLLSCESLEEAQEVQAQHRAYGWVRHKPNSEFSYRIVKRTCTTTEEPLPGSEL